MLVLSDNTTWAENLVGQKLDWQEISSKNLPQNIEPITERGFGDKIVYVGESRNIPEWNVLLAVKSARESNYDSLMQLAQDGQELPDRMLCMADEGDNFHGFKKRSWAAESGNIHLVAYVKPARRLDHIGVGFTVAGVVSVIDTIDHMSGLENQAGIKWINDILLDGAKVGGVLAGTQVVGDIVEGAVVGIGLNVECTPEISPDSFVPKVTSLKDYLEFNYSVNQGEVFRGLASNLYNYIKRYLDGGYDRIFELYKKRSVILGREVSLRVDQQEPGAEEIIRGKVTKIDSDLGLYFKGRNEPISNGRLTLDI